MISTGTDVKPLECLLFMRDVKSLGYFEQMKGRGTRVISSTDFQGVTPDALVKTHFVLVDAVGVTESCKSDGPPLERKRSESFESILLSVAKGIRDEDTLSTLAGRLAKLDRKIEDKDRAELKATAEGRPLRQVINDLVDAIDPDRQEEKARELFKVENPTEEQIKKATEEIAKAACLPFDQPRFRAALIDIKRKSEQIIDNDSKDQVIFAGYDSQALERARGTVESFKRFLDENRDEITALQIIYSKPYGKRHLTYEQIKQLAEAIERPPYVINQNQVWQAYEQLDRSRVKGAGPQKLLTNIVSLVRFALGESQVLSPFPETVEERFDSWLSQQEASGKIFNPEQIEWLRMIKEHIATSLAMGMDDFDYAPFHERGGIMRAHNLFGQDLGRIMNELNEALAG
jgi:type I restriction enzyme R subunit